LWVLLTAAGVLASYPNLRGSTTTDAWSREFITRGIGNGVAHLLHAATLPNGLVELMGTSELPDGSNVQSLVGAIQTPAFGATVPSELTVAPQTVPYEVPFGTLLPDGTVIGDLLICGGGPFDADGSLYHAGGSRFIIPPYTPEQPVLYVLGLSYPFRFYAGPDTWIRHSDSPFVGVGAQINGSPGMNGRWYSTAIHRGDDKMMIIAGSELVRYNYATGETATIANLSIELDDHGAKTLVSAAENTPAEVYNADGYTHAWQLPEANAQTLMLGTAGRPVFMSDQGQFAVRQSRRQGAGAQSEEGAAAVRLPIRVTSGEWGFSNSAVASIGGEAGTAPEHQLDVYEPVTDRWTTYDMGIRRGYPTALTLPDLRTLIVGGAGSDANTNVGYAQYWDPRDGSLTRSTEAFPEPCGYHTATTLLADGSVFMTCGQPTRIPKLGGERGTGRIFYPDYMSKERPSIVLAPAQAALGSTQWLAWSHSSPIAEVDLLSLTSTTHSFVDQRVVQMRTISTWEVNGAMHATAFALPSEPNVLPPGYYMLVVIDQQKVPSIATVIRVTR